MSKRQRADPPPSFDRQHGLFRTTSRPPESENATSIPEAAMRCQWIAMDVMAAEFGLFFVSPSMERARLIPCFDSSFPKVSTATKFVSGQNGEELVRHTRISTTPCWWADGTHSPSEIEFSRHDFIQRTGELVPGTPGIAFPVFAERGQCGLVMFMGRDIVLGADQILDIHARCFWLFHSVSKLSAEGSGRKLAMTRREIECLKLTASGYTSEQIAAALKLSVHTANQYLTNCAQKLNAVNRMQAVAKAIKVGLID